MDPVLDSLPLEEFPTLPPPHCMNFTGVCSLREEKVLSLLSFCNSDSFRDLFEYAPCTRPSTTLNHAEVFQVLCVHSHSKPSLTLLRLATGTSIRPALHLHGSNNTNQIRVEENERLTVEPPQRTLCGGIQLHSMQESPGSNRETIETYSRLSLTDLKSTMKSNTQHIKQKHNRKQVCNSIRLTVYREKSQP